MTRPWRVMMTGKSREGAPIEGEGTRSPHPVRIELASLLGGRREAIIVHNGEDYRLRVTANGKLILTK